MENDSVYADEGFAGLLIECAESLVSDEGSTIAALSQAAKEMREFIAMSDEFPSGETRCVLVSRARKVRDSADIRAAILECIFDCQPG